MRQTIRLALATVLAASVSLQAADLAALISQLQERDAKARAEARLALVRESVAAVRPLMSLVGNESPTTDREARLALLALVEQAAKQDRPAKEKAGIASALVRCLAPAQPLAQRAFAAELLGLTADSQVVAPLALLLREPDLRETARRALTLVPGREATAALVRALAQADPAFKAALLLSLGQRQAVEALPEVAVALRDGTEEVRLAALSALGQFGDPKAEGILRAATEKGPDSERAAARQSYLNLAHLLVTTHVGIATTMFRRAYATAGTEAEKGAALTGLTCLPHPPMDLLLRALESEPEKVKGAVLQGLIASRSPRVTGALVREMKRTEGPIKANLLWVLGERGEAQARAAVVQAVADPEASVRVAALLALGHIGAATDVPTLVTALKDTVPAARDAAVEALARLKGPKATRQVVEALTRADVETQRRLAQVLGERRGPQATEALVAAAKGTDAAVSSAALKALGQLNYQGIAQRRVAAAATVLLEAMKGGPEERRSVAARSYMGMAESLRQPDAAKALAMCKEALALAPRDAERRTALLGIGRFGDPATLEVISPYLSQASLQSAAAAAFIPIADALAKGQKKDQAVELYRTAAKRMSDRKLALAVVTKLRDLGVEMDLASEAGYVSQWLVLGPFGPRGEIETRDIVETASPVDLARPVVVAGQAQRWKYAPLKDPTGMLDLEQAVARQDNVAAYAYAELRSETARDVLFHIGSDDSVACWLNGKKIHEYVGDRAYTGEPDEVQATLKAGANSVLLRVGQRGGQWAVGLRITDRTGAPVLLAQKAGLDVAGDLGTIASWWVLGPFAGRNDLKQKDVLPTDKRVDTKQKVVREGQTFEWKRALIVNRDGMLDLEQSIARATDCGGYVYAEVLSDVDQQAMLHIGSDDDVVCWLNGAKVLEKFVDRPYQPDQDQVSVPLKAGPNSILLKVLQGTGQWAVGVQLTDPEGEALKVDEREPGVFVVSRQAQQEVPLAKRVLYYTLCTGFRHGVIPYSWRVLRQIGRAHQAFNVTVNEDATKITKGYLTQFDAIVLYTTGTPFHTPEAKQALLDFVKGGKGLVGIHSATDTHYDWPEFGELLGAYFDGHPWTQEVGIKVDDPQHPACRNLPTPWKIADEIYQFRNWSRDKVHMLLTIDNSTVNTKANGVKRADLDFAVAWCKKYGQGRVFFTSLGHNQSVWDDPLYQDHLLCGIRWAMKDE